MAIDYKPEQNDYTNLTPFKTWLVNQINSWGVNNFPFLEGDFDKLTNYGMLMKMMKCLNDIINNENLVEDDMSKMYQAFTELQTYINNYFDNLDVQEEINNKLDSLVADGTLENLISAYIQPRIEAQNEEIESFKTTVNSTLNTQNNKINALESGAPLKATSISGMTDTTKIYVNTTDGYWYYYDGDSWEQGGVYQASQLQNKDVHYNNLDDELQTTFDSVESPTTFDNLAPGLVNTNGTITSSSTLYYYNLSVTPFDSYYLHIATTGAYGSATVFYMFKDSNNNVISYQSKGDTTVGDDGYLIANITIPYNATTLLINTPHATNSLAYGNYINKISKYEINNIDIHNFNSKLQSIFVPNYDTEITPTVYCDSAYFADTAIYEYASAEVLSISVNPGDHLQISGTQLANNPFLLLCSENNPVVKTLNGNEYTIKSYVEKVKSTTSGGTFNNYTLIVPSYCKQIYINHLKADNTLVIKKASEYLINSSELNINSNKVGFTKLIAIGDSLTEVNYRAAHNYLYWISQDITTLTIQNLGRSGTGYKNAGGGNYSFTDRLSSISSYNLDTDVITVMGSVNDIQYVTNSLGELGDTTTDTVYGAIYTFFNTLFTSYPGVRVGCISPLNWKFSGTAKNDLELYCKALKDTCELFHVPFLDIHNETNLRPENTTFLNQYYLSDGTGHDAVVDSSGIHPNSAGHHLFYGRIKEFITKL